MNRSLRALCLALLCLAAAAGAARASNGPAPAVIGVKGPVNLPFLGDAQSAFRMPAGIAWSLDHRVDLDIFLFYSKGTLDNSLNDFESSGASFGGSFGVILAPFRDLDALAPEDPLPEEDLLTFHFGVFPELAGPEARNRVRYTTFPNKIGIAGGILFITSAFTATYTPVRWLGLGLSLRLHFARLKLRSLVGGDDTDLSGSPTINGVPLPGNPTYADFLEIFQSDSASDPTTLFDSSLTTVQFGTVLSISFRPHEDLAIGFSYTPRSWAPFPFEGDADLRAEATFNQALAGLAPAIQDLFLDTLPNRGQQGFNGQYDVELEGLHVPRQVRLNVAWWPVDRFVIAGEVAWWDWRRAFGKARLSLRNGTNEDLNFVLGSDRVESASELRFTNEWTFAVYAAFAATDDLTLRAGFHYADSPINPREQGNSGTSGFAATAITAGGSYWVTDSVELSLLVEWSLPETRRSGPTDALTTSFSKFTAEQVFVHFGFTALF